MIPYLLIPGSPLDLNTGNGTEGAMACTILGSLLRPLFYFLCSNLKAKPVHYLDSNYDINHSNFHFVRFIVISTSVQLQTSRKFRSLPTLRIPHLTYKRSGVLAAEVAE